MLHILLAKIINETAKRKLMDIRIVKSFVVTQVKSKGDPIV